MKYSELEKLTRKELFEKKSALEAEKMKLRIAVKSGSTKQNHLYKVARRGLAQVNTALSRVLNQNLGE